MRTLLVVIALAGVASADDDESKPVTYSVDGELGMHVDVTYETLTGTYHSATKLDLHTAKATLVREQPDIEKLPVLPLIEKAVAIDPNHWVMIGWSSTGGGMETMVAWIVAASGKKLRVTDELYWTSDRAHAGLAIEDDKGKLRIGIPEMPKEGAHEPGEWALQVGNKNVAFAKLKYKAASTKLFDPPMEEREVTGKVAWFTANGEKFVASH